MSQPFEIPGGLRPFARERLTVSNVVKTLTAATYEDTANVGSVNRKRAQFATVYVVGAGNILVTVDGTTPSASAGVEVPLTETYPLRRYDEIKRAKFLRDDATDADIEVTYYA
jgi:hypothetical protein